MPGFRELVADRAENTYRLLAEGRHTGSFRNLVEAHQVEHDIRAWHTANKAVLSVGTPIGMVTRSDDGRHVQEYDWGSVIKPLGDQIQIGDRFLVHIEVAGVRCFSTDDAREDEPYIIFTLFAIDPTRTEEQLVVPGLLDATKQGIRSGQVFGQAFQVTSGSFFVPGDGEVRIHASVWDQESGDPEEQKKKAGDWAKGTMATALGMLSLIPGFAWAGPAAIGAAQATGLLDWAATGIGDWVGGWFSDDLIAEHDYVIPRAFLADLRDGKIPNKTSPSISQELYNYPQADEDDSWLLHKGDTGGSYRIFFRISTQGPVASQ
jgi:hypothetical protein